MCSTLLRAGFMLTLASGFAIAQVTTPQGPSTQQNPSVNQTPHTTPPTFPEGHRQNPTESRPNNPEQANPAEPVGTPSGSLSQAQSQVQDAINKQLPSAGVVVNTTDDGKLQLSGTVSSKRQKQQAEDIARSAAPNQSIVNKISVGNGPSTAYPRQ